MAILYLGRTPLHLSAENGHIAVLKYLVDHGADVNIKDKWGEYRVYQSKTLCVDISIYYILVILGDHGADVNINLLFTSILTFLFLMRI